MLVCTFGGRPWSFGSREVGARASCPSGFQYGYIVPCVHVVIPRMRVASEGQSLQLCWTIGLLHKELMHWLTAMAKALSRTLVMSAAASTGLPSPGKWWIYILEFHPYLLCVKPYQFITQLNSTPLKFRSKEQCTNPLTYLQMQNTYPVKYDPKCQN